MISLRLPKSSVAASMILLAFSAAAHAEVNADAVLDGLKRQLALQGIELSADSASLSGGNVTLSGVTIGGGSDKDIKLDQLLLEGVEEAGNGAYVIGRMAAPAFTTENDGYTVAFEGAAIEGYYVASEDETDPVLKGGVYRQITIGGIAVAKGANPVFTLEGADATMSPYQAGGEMEYDFSVKDFTVDFSQIEDVKAREGMSELGYSTLTGRLTGDGSWNAGNGDLTMNQSFVIDDAATLNIDFALGGYTPEVIAGMQQLNSQMKDQPDEAKGLAMLGLMQQLQIGGITIELQDDSATGRILDYAAKKQGTNRTNIVAQAKGALPFVLAQLQNPEFSASVSAAVASFLDNPGTLTIKAAPASPVPVAQIVGAAMAAPQTLISVLALNVTAN